MRRVLLTVALAAGAAGAWWWLRTSPGPERAEAVADATRLHTVARQRLVVGLVENGQLQAIRHQRIYSSARQQMTIAWVIDEHKEVKKGDRLIEFDKKGFENQLLDFDKELRKQNEELERQKGAQVVRQAEAASWIRDAEAGIEHARNALRQYQFIDAPKKQRELDDAVARVQDEQVKAEAAANQAQDKLEASAFESSQVRADLEKQSQNSEGQVGTVAKRAEDAVSQCIQFRTRTCPEELERLRREVERALLTLEKEKTRAADWITSGEQAMRNTQNQIDRVKKQVEETTKTLNGCVLTAPIDGVVLYGDPETGNTYMAQYLRVGQQMWGGNNVLMAIPDMSAFFITVPIPEHYRGRVQAGSEAQISIPAIPGLDLKGRLISISTMAKPRDQSNPSSPKVFSGRVEMEASDGRMVSGMSARIALVAKVIEDCLCVPVEAVWSEGEVRYVYAETAAGTERRQVETGSLDDHHAEILRGLAAGEKVWLYDPAADGRTVRGGMVKLPPAPAAAAPAPSATRSSAPSAAAAGATAARAATAAAPATAALPSRAPAPAATAAPSPAATAAPGATAAASASGAAR